MRLILQTANVISDAKNCSYPNRVTVGNAQQLQDAVRWDHVCAECRGGYRSIANFIRSNVAVMDCDNDHSENPAEWITAQKLDELLPGVSYAVACSRHHLMEKDGKCARPRFHVYFEIAEVTDASACAALKAGIRKAYPFFDGNALDAARFIYGADCGECIWHEGWEQIAVELNYGIDNIFKLHRKALDEVEVPETVQFFTEKYSKPV